MTPQQQHFNRQSSNRQFSNGIHPSYPRKQLRRQQVWRQQSIYARLAWAIANFIGFLLLTLLMVSMVSLALGYPTESMQSFLDSWGSGISKLTILTFSTFVSLIFCDAL